MKHRRPLVHPRRAQQGAVAVVFAVSLLALLGFAGLVLDGGRLYIAKAELQNAADACALAAAQELEGPVVLAASAHAKARDAGVRVARRNRVDFQSNAVRESDTAVAFASAPDAMSWLAAGAASGLDRFARCTVSSRSIRPWFMGALGSGASTVTASAIAVRDLSVSNCALPWGSCATASSLVQ